MNTPCFVSRKINDTGWKTWRVPYHANLLRRVSNVGPKCSANCLRTALFAPSLATIRSASASVSDVFDSLAVFDLHAHPLARTLQRVQHVDARGPREMVAPDLDVLATMDDVEVIAALVIGGELVEEFLVGFTQKCESHGREHDAPPVRGVARILLIDANLMARVVLLHEER